MGLKKELLAGEIIHKFDDGRDASKANKNLRKSLRALKEQDGEDGPFEVKGGSLAILVQELEKLVDACKTKLGLLDEESTFFRHRYQDLQTEYQRLRGQFETLAMRLSKMETVNTAYASNQSG